MLATLEHPSAAAEIALIDDAKVRVKPAIETCDGTIAPMQIANFTDDGRLLIDSHLFNHPKFSPRDQAALLVHEAIYAYFRSRFEDRDSQRARRVVGILFSKLDSKAAHQKIDEALGFSPVGLYGLEFRDVPAGSAIVGSAVDGTRRKSP